MSEEISGSPPTSAQTIPASARQRTLVKALALGVGTSIVLWFITITTPSDDRTPPAYNQTTYVRPQSTP